MRTGTAPASSVGTRTANIQGAQGHASALPTLASVILTSALLGEQGRCHAHVSDKTDTLGGELRLASFPH